MSAVPGTITLDNFEERMSKWEPGLSNHLYALVDMGSNGIRFSISELSPPDARLLKCLYRERAAISLFDALNSSSTLSFPPETISQVSQTLARFNAIAMDYGVPASQVTAFATEAMRKAENSAAMLAAIHATSGLEVHILAPEVETLFGSVGARSGFSEVDGVFLDLGGGSVQMTYLNSAQPDYEITAARTGKSLPFGAARLIRILEDGQGSERLSARSELQTGMRSAFLKLQEDIPALKSTARNGDRESIDVYLCGGGFRGYGSMLMHNDPVQPYPIPAVGAYTVSGTLFSRVDEMRRVNEEYDGKIYGMSKRRRSQFPAIATVVEALIDALPRIRSVTFCAGGNREGALMMKLPKELREAKPLRLLRPPKGEDMVMDSVLNTIGASLPTGVNSTSFPTVFNVGLGPLFVSKIWTRAGEPSEANAAFELHQAVTRDPSLPGFTHLARALLGLTLCYRWGMNLAPIDMQLYKCLTQLVDEASSEANFWAEYIGGVAAALATVCAAQPISPKELESLIKFKAQLNDGKKKQKVELTILLSASAMQGLAQQDLTDIFKHVGKQSRSPGEVARKVEVKLEQME